MIIIKQGDLDKVGIYYLDFECPRCGCVFEASLDEYETENVFTKARGFIERDTCKCPCCGLKVSR